MRPPRPSHSAQPLSSAAQERLPDLSGTHVLAVDDEPDALFLGTIAVDREYRGRGLGRYLVRAALARAQNAGFSRVYLSVNALNAQARRLYESDGFTLVKAMVCLVRPL